MVGSSNGPGNGSLLFVVCEALAGKVSTSTLRNLEDDGGFDIATTSLVSVELKVIGRGLCTEQPRERRLRRTMKSRSEKKRMRQTCVTICRIKRKTYDRLDQARCRIKCAFSISTMPVRRLQETHGDSELEAW